jgi:coenzyme Q-binding protein COQ10
VEFDIDFQFKSRLLDALLAANFHHAVDRLMICFEDRAQTLHGAGPNPGSRSRTA